LELGKVPKVALVESNNPIPEAAFMALAAEDLEVELATDLKFNRLNSTKLRVKTPSSATPKRVLKAVLSTLTNNAVSNIGSK